MEILNLNSKDLVEAFEDRIENNYDNICLKLGIENEVCENEEGSV